MDTCPKTIFAKRINPHEEFMLGYGTVIGGLHLSGMASFPASIEQLPTLMSYAWAMTLFASGIIGIIGLRLRGELSFTLELGGLLLASGPMLMLAVFGLLKSDGGWMPLISAGLLGAFVSSHMFRAWQIWRQIVRINKRGD